MDDETGWIENARAGDTAAFGHLVALHQRRLFGFLVSRTADETAADELAQVTFLKAWRGLPRFRGECAFQTWLFQIALNESRSWGRRQKIKRLREWALGALGGRDTDGDPDAESLPDRRTDGDPERSAENAELGRRLRAAVTRLPEKERAVFLMRHDQDMALADIAATLGIALGTVKAHLFHAVRKVRQGMEDL